MFDRRSSLRSRSCARPRSPRRMHRGGVAHLQRVLADPAHLLVAELRGIARACRRFLLRFRREARPRPDRATGPDRPRRPRGRCSASVAVREVSGTSRLVGQAAPVTASITARAGPTRELVAGLVGAALGCVGAEPGDHVQRLGAVCWPRSKSSEARSCRWSAGLVDVLRPMPWPRARTRRARSAARGRGIPTRPRRPRRWRPGRPNDADLAVVLGAVLIPCRRSPAGGPGPPRPGCGSTPSSGFAAVTTPRPLSFNLSRNPIRSTLAME